MTESSLRRHLFKEGEVFLKHRKMGEEQYWKQRQSWSWHLECRKIKLWIGIHRALVLLWIETCEQKTSAWNLIFNSTLKLIKAPSTSPRNCCSSLLTQCPFIQEQWYTNLWEIIPQLVQTTVPAMKLTQPGIHTGLVSLLNKLILLKSWLQLLHHYRFAAFCFWPSKLIICSPFQKSVGSSVVFILDWPHQFPSRGTAQIWQLSGKHSDALLPSLHFLQKDWQGVMEEKKWIMNRGYC